MRTKIHDEQVPAPAGPYSQAVVADGPMAFISGQLPLDLASGRPVGGGFREQAELVFERIGRLLRASGSGWDQVVRLTVMLADLRDFGELGEVSRQFLVEPYPARTTFQAGLPPGVALEVDCVARVTGVAP